MGGPGLGPRWSPAPSLLSGKLWSVVLGILLFHLLSGECSRSCSLRRPRHGPTDGRLEHQKRLPTSWRLAGPLVPLCLCVLSFCPTRSPVRLDRDPPRDLIYCNHSVETPCPGSHELQRWGRDTGVTLTNAGYCPTKDPSAPLPSQGHSKPSLP